MSWKKTIIDAHLSVTDSVSHYRRLKSDRYFVWAEDGTLISMPVDDGAQLILQQAAGLGHVAGIPVDLRHGA